MRNKPTVTIVLAACWLAAGCGKQPTTQRPERPENRIEKRAEADFVFVIHPDSDETKPERGTELLDINDFGQIVGGFWDKEGVVRGFLLTETGLADVKTVREVQFSERWKFHNIEIAGASFTRAYGINNNKMIVGAFTVDGVGRGFKLTADEVVEAANKPIRLTADNVIDIGGINTQALGVNDMGTIVGGYTEKNGEVVGFQLEVGGEPQKVEIGSGNITSVHDITEDGFAVGSYGVFNTRTGFLESSVTFVLDEQRTLAVNKSLGFDGTNSGLAINRPKEIAGIVGEFATCSGNLSFIDSLINPDPTLVQIPDRRTTAIGGLNNVGLFVGATDNEFGALVGFVGTLAN